MPSVNWSMYNESFVAATMAEETQKMGNRKRHSTEQIVVKLHDADRLLSAGQSVGHVCQTLSIHDGVVTRQRLKGKQNTGSPLVEAGGVLSAEKGEEKQGCRQSIQTTGEVRYLARQWQEHCNTSRLHSSLG